MNATIGVYTTFKWFTTPPHDVMGICKLVFYMLLSLLIFTKYSEAYTESDSSATPNVSIQMYKCLMTIISACIV